MSDPFHYEAAVRFSDVDLYGVVWHGRYVAWLEEARNAYASRAGFSLLDELKRGYRYPIVELNIEYKSSVSLGDVVRVRPRLAPEPIARITFEYDLRRVADGRQVARARTRQVILRGDELLVTIPASIQRVLAEIERLDGPSPATETKGTA